MRLWTAESGFESLPPSQSRFPAFILQRAPSAKSGRFRKASAAKAAGRFERERSEDRYRPQPGRSTRALDLVGKVLLRVAHGGYSGLAQHLEKALHWKPGQLRRLRERGLPRFEETYGRPRFRQVHPRPWPSELARLK